MTRSLSWSVCIQTKFITFCEPPLSHNEAIFIRGCVWHITHSENETSRFCVCACVRLCVQTMTWLFCISLNWRVYVHSAVKALAEQADKAVRSEGV